MMAVLEEVRDAQIEMDMELSPIEECYVFIQRCREIAQAVRPVRAHHMLLGVSRYIVHVCITCIIHVHGRQLRVLSNSMDRGTRHVCVWLHICYCKVMSIKQLIHGKLCLSMRYPAKNF